MAQNESPVLMVRSVCGWEVRGPEDVVVEATQEHGRRSHNMMSTRDQVLEMAVEVEGRSRPYE